MQDGDSASSTVEFVGVIQDRAAFRHSLSRTHLSQHGRNTVSGRCEKGGVIVSICAFEVSLVRRQIMIMTASVVGNSSLEPKFPPTWRANRRQGTSGSTGMT